MELQRGICSLCSEITKVFTCSDAEEYHQLLPEILQENFLTSSEFQKIKNSIKICAICCFKLQTAANTKKLIDSSDKKRIKSKEDICHFCQTNKCLMKVDSKWKYLSDKIEGYVNPTDFPISACTKCLFFFYVIYTFKTKLSYKFPQLIVGKKKPKETTQTQSDTPKKKLSMSPPSSSKRKIFSDCFTYLQPLCRENYHIERKLKTDARLYKQIAYVNLKNSQNVKETPKLRPVIKIKLKPRHKRSDKESHGEKTHARLSKSEELPSRIEQNKSRKRRFSQIDKKELAKEKEEKLQETPKAGSIENLVPKRRVSVYIENAEKENQDEKQNEDGKENQDEKQDEDEKETLSEEEEVKEGSNEETKEDYNKEVEENTTEGQQSTTAEQQSTPEEQQSTTEEQQSSTEEQQSNTEEQQSTTEEQQSTTEEQEATSPKKTETEKTVLVNTNGLEPVSETAESDAEVESTDINTANVISVDNGENLESTEVKEEIQKTTAEEEAVEELINSPDLSKDTPNMSPSKNESSSEGEDSGSLDGKDKKDVSESDVFNGSERKKKKVTFSDEINN